MTARNRACPEKMALASISPSRDNLIMSTLRWLSILFASFFFFSCSSEPGAEVAPEAAWTHVVKAPSATWYKGGPQQGSPPDGQIAEGTKVKLIRNAGSYCEIVAESGEAGYVSTDSIVEIAP